MVTPSTLYQAEHMHAASGIFLEGFTKRDAQTWLLTVPISVASVSAIVFVSLDEIEFRYRNWARTYAFIEDFEAVWYYGLCGLCSCYFVWALSIQVLCCCCCPRRTWEGFVSLLPLPVFAFISFVYAYSSHGHWDTQDPEIVFTYGSLLFRLAASLEFMMQLVGMWMADRLRGEFGAVYTIKRRVGVTLLFFWFGTFFGPHEVSDGDVPEKYDHALVAIGYCARVFLFLYALAHVSGDCWCVNGVWCVFRCGFGCCCRRLCVNLQRLCCGHLQDWRQLEELACTPGRNRLRYLTYFVLTRPILLLLVYLPFGYPLVFMSGFAFTMRCGLALLMAFLLSPTSKWAQTIERVEEETRESFDIALALRLLDFAWEAYEPLVPEAITVNGFTHRTVLDGEYRLAGPTPLPDMSLPSEHRLVYARVQQPRLQHQQQQQQQQQQQDVVLQESALVVHGSGPASSAASVVGEDVLTEERGGVERGRSGTGGSATSAASAAVSHVSATSSGGPAADVAGVMENVPHSSSDPSSAVPTPRPSPRATGRSGNTYMRRAAEGWEFARAEVAEDQGTILASVGSDAKVPTDIGSCLWSEGDADTMVNIRPTSQAVIPRFFEHHVREGSMPWGLVEELGPLTARDKITSWSAGGGAERPPSHGPQEVNMIIFTRGTNCVANHLSNMRAALRWPPSCAPPAPTADEAERGEGLSSATETLVDQLTRCVERHMLGRSMEVAPLWCDDSDLESPVAANATDPKDGPPVPAMSSTSVIPAAPASVAAPLPPDDSLDELLAAPHSESLATPLARRPRPAALSTPSMPSTPYAPPSPAPTSTGPRPAVPATPLATPAQSAPSASRRASPQQARGPLRQSSPAPVSASGSEARPHDDLAVDMDTLKDMAAHSGFLREYEKLRHVIMALVRLRLDLHRQEGRVVNVFLVGHSLGGAVSYFLAMDLASARRVDPSRPGSHVPLLERKPKVYTFGSPRPGNAAFRSVYNMLVPDTYRIVAGRDLVPAVPPSWGYRQLGREVWFDNTGTATFVMSWAMRHILPPRDDVNCHFMQEYYSRMGKAFRKDERYNEEFLSAFRTRAVVRDALRE